MTTVELRGPCGHLHGELEWRRRAIRVRCKRCSRRYKRAVFHWFSVETGEPIAAGADEVRLGHEEARRPTIPKA